MTGGINIDCFILLLPQVRAVSTEAPQEQSPVIRNFRAYERVQFRVRAWACRNRLRQSANEVTDGGVHGPDFVGGGKRTRKIDFYSLSNQGPGVIAIVPHRSCTTAPNNLKNSIGVFCFIIILNMNMQIALTACLSQAIPLNTTQRSRTVRRAGDANGCTVLLGMDLSPVPPEKQPTIIRHVRAYERIQFRVRAGACRNPATAERE